jgi:flagellar biosynthesis protein FlhF
MSKIKKVQGSSVQEAVKIATAMYGDDISIIETKSIKGVFGKAKGYEVIVSLPEAEEEEFHREERKSRFQNHLQSKYGGGESKREFKNDGGVSVQFGNSKPKRKYSLLDEEEEEVPEKVEKPKARSSESIDVSANAKKIMELAKKRQMEANGEKFVADEVAPKRVRKESSSEENYYKDIKSEIGQLNDKIKLIQNMFWEEKHPETTISTTIPPEFSEIYKITKQSGMNLEHLDKSNNDNSNRKRVYS